MWGRKFPRIMELAIVAGGITGARVSYFKSFSKLLTSFGGELLIVAFVSTKSGQFICWTARTSLPASKKACPE
jgi:hypothetical protein